MFEQQFAILGCGAWSPWFTDWDALVLALRGGSLQPHDLKSPSAAIIPANERRRAPLPVKLAVDASMQACSKAGIDPETLASVFVSGLGDTQLTDYMCKTLASDNKALSPTRFHNSVHNAAAGYWTISVGCMRASNSLAAYEESVSMALLETAMQSSQEQAPMLLTFYDSPVSPILQPMLKNESAFGLSLVLAPAGPDGDADAADDAAPVLSMRVASKSVSWPELELPEELANCYSSNPAGRSLLLAKLLAAGAGTLEIPVSTGSALEIGVKSP